jgi:hypothetical protein
VPDGGKYAEETVALYKSGIAGVDHHMQQQQRKQHDLISAEEQRMEAGTQQALEHVQSLLPAHKEDMCLVEAMDK